MSNKLKIGDLVRVYIYYSANDRYSEGVAHLVKHVEGDRWFVRFTYGEPVVRVVFKEDSLNTAANKLTKKAMFECMADEIEKAVRDIVDRYKPLIKKRKSSNNLTSRWVFEGARRAITR